MGVFISLSFQNCSNKLTQNECNTEEQVSKQLFFSTFKQTTCLALLSKQLFLCKHFLLLSNSIHFYLFKCLPLSNFSQNFIFFVSDQLFLSISFSNCFHKSLSKVVLVALLLSKFKLRSSEIIEYDKCDNYQVTAMKDTQISRVMTNIGESVEDFDSCKCPTVK